ncbi:integrase, catalytic region, zinc finger, CCHC-type containing protein [Tanacetum coccineum]
MSTSKTYQQSLADAGSENRPPMLERGSYIPWASLTIPRLQTVEDLKGGDLLLYDAEMELMNMILLSIPNEIYNSVDAYTSAKDMWKRVERLTRGTIQNKVDRETRFTNEFDQFVVELGEALVSVYNCFAQLMNDLEQNNMNFPTKSSNHSRRQVNIKSRNFGNTGRNNRRAYVQEEVVEGMNARNETGNVQRTLRTPSSSNTSTVQCYNCSGKGHYARNCPKPRVRDSKYFMEQMLLAKQDEAGVILTNEQNDFLFADASRMEEIKELSANICLMARIQPADHTSDDGPSYESAFISEVQSSSIDENNEPMGNVNSGSVDKDTHVPDLCAVEKLARNAYQEAKKQRIFAKQVQTQNTHLTSQIEMYKERVRILEGINKDNNYLNEFLEADEQAKRYNKQAQSQLKVIQNGNSKKRISTGKDGVVRILPPVSPAEIHAVEKERKARTMFTHGYSQGNICEDLRGLVDAKEIWKAIRTRFGGNANLKKMHKAVLKQQQFKRDSFYQDQGARKKEQKQNCLLTMDDGVVNWGEHTVEEEESNHALMAISSSNEVSLCSKTCIDSYNKLKTLCDEQMNQLEDSVGKPLYNRFTKTNDFKGVPHPLSGDYTPTPQEEIDESLYVYGKKGPQEPEPSVSDDRSSEYSTCQSNDSAGSIGTSSKHSVDLESEISRGFNHANQFVPRPVQLNAGRPNINSVRHNINTGRTNINSVRPNINTGRTNINFVRPNINTGRTNVNHVRPRVNTGSSNVNTVRSRQHHYQTSTRL